MTNANDKTHPEIYTDLKVDGTHDTYSVGGLTKREYFAAMAMQGFAASSFMIDEQCIKEAARRSVIAADALITALNQP